MRTYLIHFSFAHALVGLAFGGVFVSDLEAQRIPSAFEFIDTRQEIGFFAGILSTSEGQFDLGPQPGPYLGAYYEFGFGGPFSFEANVGVLSTTRSLVDPDIEDVNSRLIGESDVTMGLADVRLKWQLTGSRTWHNLAPYVSVGAGFAFDLSDTDQFELDNLEEPNRFDFGTKFKSNLGLGTKLFLSDRLALKLEGLFMLYTIDTPDGFLASEFFTGVPRDESVRSLVLTAGLSIRF